MPGIVTKHILTILVKLSRQQNVTWSASDMVIIMYYFTKVMLQQSDFRGSKINQQANQQFMLNVFIFSIDYVICEIEPAFD